MITVHKADQDIAHQLDLVDGAGLPVAVVSASYSLYDDEGAALQSDIAVDVSDDPDFVVITIPAAQNQVAGDDLRAFRKVELTYENNEGSQYKANVSYIIESANVLTVGINSFASYGQLAMQAQDYSELTVLHNASEKDQVSAFINAFYNIANLKVDFGLDDVYSTLDLGASGIASLSTEALTALKRAQVIEANAILGGNPVEDRRRMGLISDSAGESTHFFRTTKPLELPVSKATANALRGYISWRVRIGRG